MEQHEIIFKYIQLREILVKRYGMDVYCDRKCMYVNDKETGKSSACSSLDMLQGMINALAMVEEEEEDAV